MAVNGKFRRGHAVSNRHEELRRRFGAAAMPLQGETPTSFFGAVARQPKSALPDQDWCRQNDGAEPPWFGVNVPDPVTGRTIVRTYWAACVPWGERSVFADRGHRERVAVAMSWAEARAALAARHGVPVSAVEVRRSLPAPVRQ